MLTCAYIAKYTPTAFNHKRMETGDTKPHHKHQSFNTKKINFIILNIHKTRTLMLVTVYSLLIHATKKSRIVFNREKIREKSLMNSEHDLLARPEKELGMGYQTNMILTDPEFVMKGLN